MDWRMSEPKNNSVEREATAKFFFEILVMLLLTLVIIMPLSFSITEPCGL
jgi:hypothetical protein